MRKDLSQQAPCQLFAMTILTRHLTTTRDQNYSNTISYAPFSLFSALYHQLEKYFDGSS